MTTFQPGQRWTSEAEPELGLGLVSEVGDQRVTLAFPATGEVRQYAVGLAPLRRVRFAPGLRIDADDGTSLTVEAVEEGENGTLTYLGSGRRLGEEALSHAMTFSEPDARFLSGRVDERSAFALRLDALECRSEVERSALRGFVGGRIELIPHQLYIAHEVCRRLVPRVLLSDEVGLGKTIEACMILHRLHLAGRADRVLVLVPDALVHQWFVELLRRFNLSFAIYDAERLGDVASQVNGVNPFLEDSLVLCGMDLLSGDAGHGLQAVQAGWDLVIVDEAHHLKWEPGDPSAAYGVVEALAKVSEGLLLLTATPEQLGPASYFASLRLLDPDRYHSLERFLEEQEGYEAVADQATALKDAGDETALRELLDAYGPGRVVFRNTRASMTGFPRRIPHLVGLEACAERDDPRIAWLLSLLEAQPEDKLLVIAQSRKAVEAIEQALKSRSGVRIAKFHEGLTLVQRDRQAAWFHDPEGARILLASGIGGEGRNFQFVQHLVLYDLPEDPEVLEQRIGRLDRIGQAGDIHIHVPYVEGSRTEGLARWLHEGLDAFTHPVAAGYELHRRFAARLDRVNAALLKETRKVHDELKRRMAHGRDRLLEWSSRHPDAAHALVESVAAIDTSPALKQHLVPLMEHFGVIVERLDDHDFLLQRGPMFSRDFSLPDEGLRITFDRRRALAREDVTLMSWDHPLVRDAEEMLLSSDAGRTAFVVGEWPTVELLVEAVHVLECLAPRGLEGDRYLPPTPIRTLIAHSGQPYSGGLPDTLNDGDPYRILDKEKIRTTMLPHMVKRSRELAEDQSAEVVQSAIKAMRMDLGAERERMLNLKQVNDHIRDEEVDCLLEREQQLSVAFAESRLRLDAIRVIMLTPKP